MSVVRSPISHEPDTASISVDDFHEAMSRHGSSVCIVTTDGPTGRCGLTASSVTSVSDQPPIILNCVNRQARTCNTLTEDGVFAVNVLHAGSERLANAFAGCDNRSVEERFSLAEWCQHEGGTGAPMLKGALVSIDCKVIDRIDSGTHRVFFGQVVALKLGPSAPSLLHVDRSYTSIRSPI